MNSLAFAALKRSNPWAHLHLSPKSRQKIIDLKDKKADFEEPVDLFWLHCQFQMRPLTFTDQFGKPWTVACKKQVAQNAYSILIDNARNPSTILNFKYNLISKFFLSVISLTQNCCVFQGRKILGKGCFKTAYEALLIEIIAQKASNIIGKEKEVGIPFIKISSVALLVIQNDDDEVDSIGQSIYEDDLAGKFNLPYITRKSLYRVKIDTDKKDRYGRIKTDSTLYLVQKRFAFEFATRIKDKALYSFEQSIRATRDAAKGLAELHRNEIIHRDVKPGNMAVKMNGDGLLFDIGFACKINPESNEPPQLSPLYAAPELLKNEICYFPSEEIDVYFKGKKKQSIATDLWAFGLSLFEICSPNHRVPSVLENIRTHDQLQILLLKIRDNKIDFQAQLFNEWKAPNRGQQKLQDLIKKLLFTAPEKRGTAAEVAAQLDKIYHLIPGVYLRESYEKRRRLDGLLLTPLPKMWKARNKREQNLQNLIMLLSINPIKHKKAAKQAIQFDHTCKHIPNIHVRKKYVKQRLLDSLLLAPLPKVK